MSEPSVDEIVAEFEMKMTGMREATCVALRSGQVRALIADWRKRGEALARQKTDAELGRR